MRNVLSNRHRYKNQDVNSLLALVMICTSLLSLVLTLSLFLAMAAALHGYRNLRGLCNNEAGVSSLYEVPSLRLLFLERKC